MTPSQAVPALSLQEFLKEPANFEVPECYVCEEKESPVPAEAFSLPPLPTVDMKRLLGGETADLELHKLHTACKEWGFFQLVNHGVRASLIKNVKSEIEKFFKLPLEEKMKYKRRPGDSEGYGQTLALSKDLKLDWGDRFYMLVNPVHERKPHLLPGFPPSLRDTLESYFSELQRVAMTLMGQMARGLEVELGEVEETFEDGMQSLRMTHYPPCPQPEKVMGLKSHTDGSGLTILLQVNGVQGLQIKKDGIWRPVNFHPNAFVVNIGDILEIWSNGVYKSVEHRATVNSTQERFSLAMFFSPKLQAEVGPARSLINSQNPPLFESIVMRNYLKKFFSRQLDRKTNIEHMRIIRKGGKYIG
ncbi:protein SRG1-like [Malania oleifera]|uniref:protein SRG1-like n=1 Tax=Malania oleifera TaxID=397392 RepID=UPI0025AEC550|nr:protein SRG1-like [Malania oleifera]